MFRWLFGPKSLGNILAQFDRINTQLDEFIEDASRRSNEQEALIEQLVKDNMALESDIARAERVQERIAKLTE